MVMFPAAGGRWRWRAIRAERLRTSVFGLQYTEFARLPYGWRAPPGIGESPFPGSPRAGAAARASIAFPAGAGHSGSGDFGESAENKIHNESIFNEKSIYENDLHYLVMAAPIGPKPAPILEISCFTGFLGRR